MNNAMPHYHENNVYNYYKTITWLLVTALLESISIEFSVIVKYMLNNCCLF